MRKSKARGFENTCRDEFAKLLSLESVNANPVASRSVPLFGPRLTYSGGYEIIRNAAS
jgi:hypothetical protein